MSSSLYREFAFNRWANQKWIEWVYARDSGDLHPYKLINHIVKAERAWTDRIVGLEWNKDLWTVEEKEELEILADNMRLRMEGFAEQPLSERIAIVRLNGDRYNPLVSDILRHILMHGAHHRGQLAAYAARMGVTYPMADYMAYCREEGL